MNPVRCICTSVGLTVSEGYYFRAGGGTDHDWTIECDDCGMEAFGRYREDAIRAWNGKQARMKAIEEGKAVR